MPIQAADRESNARTRAGPAALTRIVNVANHQFRDATGGQTISWPEYAFGTEMTISVTGI